MSRRMLELLIWGFRVYIDAEQSGIFFKTVCTTWQRMNYRRATHVKTTQFLGYCKKSPSGEKLPPGDACGVMFAKNVVFRTFQATGTADR